MTKFWNVLYSSLGYNQPLAIFIAILVVFVLIAIIPFLVNLIFAFTKEKLNSKGTVLLYAFMCGFFLTMATFGFLKESLEISSINTSAILNSDFKIYGWNILVVVGGLIIGIGFAALVRQLVRKSINSKIATDKSARLFLHSHDIGHDHGDMDHHEHEIAPSHDIQISSNAQSKPAYKLVAILLLLLHRIPEGFLIGFIISGIESKGITSTSVAFLISLILHLIPEQVLFYYRQREMGWSRAKALFISTLCLFLFLPAMLLGGYLGKHIYSIWQLRAMVQSFIAGIFIFISILEFLPEFYHAHHDKKLFFWTIFVFMVGIIFCAFVLAFHKHGQGI
ncbi:ZIP family metal transporter [Mycoplasmopsis agalactiae]|uniref:ZIP family metal transporter n=1 Tax=Mycoplasmopsis agalactiae TaxID=2110 RepID=UPI001F2608D9|nr:ZIP family metal transporter [Mycoplasmopsis agalactiae]MCE6115509.1 ZIP family metal transporter [Mycoplasmopsis agalactiae]